VQKSSSLSPSPEKTLNPQSKEESIQSIGETLDTVVDEVAVTKRAEEEERTRKIEAEKAIAYNREQARLEEERIEAQRRQREEEREAARKEQEELENELRRKKEEEEEARKKLEEEEKSRLEAEENERKREEEERLVEAKRKEEARNKETIETQRQLQAEKERKEEEDKAAIKAAREKVLARRRKSATSVGSDFKNDTNTTSKSETTSSTSGGWNQARRSPKNGGDTSLNSTTYDDIQTGFEASPRGGNTSYDSGW